MAADVFSARQKIRERVLNGFAIRSCAALTALLTFASAANAWYVVDTGQPADPTIGSWLSPVGLIFDGIVSNGGMFSISSTTTISEIQGFMQVSGAGNITVSLYAGSPEGSLLFSKQRFVVPSESYPYEWVGINGLNWTVPAGTYGFAISSPDYFSGSMPWGAPMPLDEEWQGFNGSWNRYDEADLGFRVSATLAPVPEPATYALMLAGFGCVGAIARRHKRG